MPGRLCIAEPAIPVKITAVRMKAPHDLTIRRAMKVKLAEPFGPFARSRRLIDSGDVVAVATLGHIINFDAPISG